MINLVYVLLLTFSFSVFAASDNFGEPPDNDAELNAIYKKVMQLNDPWVPDAIKKSQRTWLKSRNESCDVLTLPKHYDNDASELCLFTENASRIKFLTSIYEIFK